MDTQLQNQQSQSRRPPYSQTSTQSAPSSPALTSGFQSSSSRSSIASMNTTGTRQQPPMLQTQQGGLVSAPLPSPSGSQPSNYFGSIAQQPPPSHATQQQQQQQQQQRIPQQQTADNQYQGQRGDGGGAPETTPFLKDFNLVAEAAKRAQMACLTRDLGDVGL